ncbi:MAG: STAS domain-containing protein, partial [Anaerolineaceae bacterium]|nr:STAS domain-containing protein [Anaerolineaceae bacterium]
TIRVNVKNMTYISSAGLRVLLMMYKSLKNKDNFILMNASPEIIEIFELTGFDQLLMSHK